MRVLLTVVTALALTGCASQSRFVAEHPSSTSVVSAPASSGPSASSAPSTPPVRATSEAPASADRRGTIPWLDLPGQHLQPTPLPTRPLTTTAAPCTAHQLREGGHHHPGDTQDSGTIVELVNVSSTTCLLAGPVHAVLFSDTLRPRQVVGGLRSGRLSNDDSYDMQPGQATMIWFFATDACDAGMTRTPPGEAIRVADITIPGGGHLRVGGLDLAQTCHGPTVSDFWRPHPDPVYAPAPLEGAAVTLVAPKSVKARSTLRYTVEISNPTNTPITMNPCPSYHQFLSPFPDKRFYRLNCDGHTDLLAHETLRFAMQLEVPPQEEVGRQKVVWLLDTTVQQPQPVIVDITRSSVGPEAPSAAAASPAPPGT